MVRLCPPFHLAVPPEALECEVPWPLPRPNPPAVVHQKVCRPSVFETENKYRRALAPFLGADVEEGDSGMGPPRPEVANREALDDFQHEAIQALARGDSVVVSAPTGAGKTRVALHALRQALPAAHPGRAAYVCPTKALVHQVFRDLHRHLSPHLPALSSTGRPLLGLLTADAQVAPDALLVVTVPQILRLQLLDPAEPVDGLRLVVLDEVHLIAQADGGEVWEELLLLLPGPCRFLALSATVPDFPRFIRWLRSFREEPVTAVCTADRPVPQLYSVVDADRGLLKPVNPLAFAGPHHPAFLPEFVTLADLFELHRALDRVLCRHAADLGTPAHGVLAAEVEADGADDDAEEVTAENDEEALLDQAVEPDLAEREENHGMAVLDSTAEAAKGPDAAATPSLPAASPKAVRKEDKDAALLQAVLAHLTAQGALYGVPTARGVTQKQLFATVGEAAGLTGKKFANFLAKQTASSNTAPLVLDKAGAFFVRQHQHPAGTALVAATAGPGSGRRPALKFKPRDRLLQIAVQLARAGAVTTCSPTSAPKYSEAEVDAARQAYAPDLSLEQFARFLRETGHVLQCDGRGGLQLNGPRFVFRAAAEGDATPATYRVPAAWQGRADTDLPPPPTPASVAALDPWTFFTALVAPSEIANPPPPSPSTFAKALQQFLPLYAAALLPAYLAAAPATRRRVQSRLARRLPPAEAGGPLPFSFNGLCRLRRALERAEAVPALVFLLSRAGCDALLRQASASPDRRSAVAKERCAACVKHFIGSVSPAEALVYERLGYLAALAQGIAVHHSGCRPDWRRLVEGLCMEGCLALVVATGTLALGIHVPCRAAVFWADSPHLLPLAFQQMAGRAGRRGLDAVGRIVFLTAAEGAWGGFAADRLRQLCGAPPQPLLRPSLLGVEYTLRLLQLARTRPSSSAAALSHPITASDSEESDEVVRRPLRLALHLHLLHAFGYITAASEDTHPAAFVLSLEGARRDRFALHQLLAGEGPLAPVSEDVWKMNTWRQVLLLMIHFFDPGEHRPDGVDLEPAGPSPAGPPPA
eukprot:EG_transcript_1626